jgi:hypothetical protein
MGSVFRKTTTRPLPPGAEIFTRKGERFARWKTKGKTRTAPLTTGAGGANRIVTESPFYVAKYRDGSGVVQTVSTGCRDETAARQMLADLERRAERITAGMMTPAEDRMVDHLAAPLEVAFVGFDEYLVRQGHFRDSPPVHRPIPATPRRRMHL